MENEKNENTEKTAVEETVNLKIPSHILAFAEFYADLGGVERDALLTDIVICRIREIKEQFKAMPHMQIPETF